MSPKGWTSFAHGLSWIEHFNNSTANRTVSSKRLLILDGHDSHMTDEFQSYCKFHNIITLCMPAHSSHLLQPLDVGCFGPLKRAYSAQMQELGRHRYWAITKDDFIPEFNTAFQRSFTKDNIQGAFRGSGLYPLDPQAVLSKLTLTIRTPSPLLPTLSAWQSQTPHNVLEIDCQTSLITNKILQHDKSSPTHLIEAVNRLSRGFQKHTTASALLEAELTGFRKVVEKLQSYRGKKRKWFKSSQPLTAVECQSIIDQPAIDSQLVEILSTIVPEEPLVKRKKSKCSICSSELHTARTCLA